MKIKPTILILCTGNSCRSHMAEGYLQHKVGDLANVQSAGSKPSDYVHPIAIKVMEEVGIDLTSHRSKHLDEYKEQNIDTVITVCDNAEHCCPTFTGEKNHYCWTFSDPADATGTDEEIANEFRRVRDEIRETFDKYAEELCLQLSQS